MKKNTFLQYSLQPGLAWECGHRIPNYSFSHAQEGSVGAYNYGAAQGAPADANKPSAAAQAIYSLPPAQQEKLSQIISQVRPLQGLHQVVNGYGSFGSTKKMAFFTRS